MPIHTSMDGFLSRQSYLLGLENEEEQLAQQMLRQSTPEQVASRGFALLKLCIVNVKQGSYGRMMVELFPSSYSTPSSSAACASSSSSSTSSDMLIYLPPHRIRVGGYVSIFSSFGSLRSIPAARGVVHCCRPCSISIVLDGDDSLENLSGDFNFSHWPRADAVSSRISLSWGSFHVVCATSSLPMLRQVTVISLMQEFEWADHADAMIQVAFNARDATAKIKRPTQMVYNSGRRPFAHFSAVGSAENQEDATDGTSESDEEAEDEVELGTSQLGGGTVGLNASQRSAVSKCLSWSPFVLLLGPPGTGKTTTLSAVIAALMAKGLRVLACAPSNVAVDNLLEKCILAGVPKRKCLRLGHPARLSKCVLHCCMEQVIKHTDSSLLCVDVRRELSACLHELSRPRCRGGAAYEVRAEARRLRKEAATYEGRAAREALKAASVVFATCVGADNKALQKFVHQEEDVCGQGGGKTAARPFDVVCIDEAAQAMEISCWIPLLLGRRAILAGDPHQLPPTVKSPAAARGGLSISLFERLAFGAKRNREQTLDQPRESLKRSDAEEGGRRSEATGACAATAELSNPGREMETNIKKNDEALAIPKSHKLSGFVPCSLLEVQYRMHSSIMRWSNNEFYDGRLKAHSSVTKAVINAPVSDQRGKHLASQEDEADVDTNRLCPLVWIDTAGTAWLTEDGAENFKNNLDEGGLLSSGGSRSNTGEAALLVKYVKHLLIDWRVEIQSISVITPYTKQVEIIRSFLADAKLFPEDSRWGSPLSDFASCGDLARITVNTVDSFQGRESDVVLLSLVRSNTEGSIGFLSDIRRLNVAVTRAKRHLCIIGDSHTVTAKTRPFSQKRQEGGHPKSLFCPKEPNQTAKVLSCHKVSSHAHKAIGRLFEVARNSGNLLTADQVIQFHKIPPKQDAKMSYLPSPASSSDRMTQPALPCENKNVKPSTKSAVNTTLQAPKSAATAEKHGAKMSHLLLPALSSAPTTQPALPGKSKSKSKKVKPSTKSAADTTLQAPNTTATTEGAKISHLLTPSFQWVLMTQHAIPGKSQSNKVKPSTTSAADTTLEAPKSAATTKVTHIEEVPKLSTSGASIKTSQKELEKTNPQQITNMEQGAKMILIPSPALSSAPMTQPALPGKSKSKSKKVKPSTKSAADTTLQAPNTTATTEGAKISYSLPPVLLSAPMTQPALPGKSQSNKVKPSTTSAADTTLEAPKSAATTEVRPIEEAPKLSTSGTAVKTSQ
eukprot:GHVT01028191.1.p1 GENE.GHVT01028191.1~~GHVT01028191.1.p1  ORF type:complete len:1241 (+),score=192.89 GHVT01028191.1:221-3943(+)